MLYSTGREVVPRDLDLNGGVGLFTRLPGKSKARIAFKRNSLGRPAPSCENEATRWSHCLSRCIKRNLRPRSLASANWTNKRACPMLRQDALPDRSLTDLCGRPCCRVCAQGVPWVKSGCYSVTQRLRSPQDASLQRSGVRLVTHLLTKE